MTTITRPLLLTTNARRSREALQVPAAMRAGSAWLLSYPMVATAGATTWTLSAAKAALVWDTGTNTPTTSTTLDLANHAYMVFALAGTDQCYAVAQEDWLAVSSGSVVCPIAWVDSHHDLVPRLLGGGPGGGVHWTGVTPPLFVNHFDSNGLLSAVHFTPDSDNSVIAYLSGGGTVSLAAQDVAIPGPAAGTYTAYANSDGTITLGSGNAVIGTVDVFARPYTQFSPYSIEVTLFQLDRGWITGNAGGYDTTITYIAYANPWTIPQYDFYEDYAEGGIYVSSNIYAYPGVGENWGFLDTTTSFAASLSTSTSISDPLCASFLGLSGQYNGIALGTNGAATYVPTGVGVTGNCQTWTPVATTGSFSFTNAQGFSYWTGMPSIGGHLDTVGMDATFTHYYFWNGWVQTDTLTTLPVAITSFTALPDGSGNVVFTVQVSPDISYMDSTSTNTGYILIYDTTSGSVVGTPTSTSGSSNVQTVAYSTAKGHTYVGVWSSDATSLSTDAAMSPSITIP